MKAKQGQQPHKKHHLQWILQCSLIMNLNLLREVWSLGGRLLLQHVRVRCVGGCIEIRWLWRRTRMRDEKMTSLVVNFRIFVLSLNLLFWHEGIRIVAKWLLHIFFLFMNDRYFRHIPCVLNAFVCCLELVNINWSLCNFFFMNDCDISDMYYHYATDHWVTFSFVNDCNISDMCFVWCNCINDRYCMLTDSPSFSCNWALQKQQR